MSELDLTRAVKQTAQELGFDYCRMVPIGPAPVGQAPHADFFEAWLGQARIGEMGYLARNVEKRRWPKLLADPDAADFRSMVVLAVNHHQFELPQALRDDPSRGIIAAYAWGDDYHEIIRPKLYELDAFVRQQSGRQSPGKCLVDTGPVLERDWAQTAGIGFTGKNCCTIHPQDGSWLLLATILLPELLLYDPPPVLVDESMQASEKFTELLLQGAPPAEPYGHWHIAASPNVDSLSGTCGRCTRCLDTCPTAAFVGPYHLDPQRCISYWTIESRQPIPRALRSHFANRIFGCDICQEVCPWNHRLGERTPGFAGLQAQEARIAPPLLEGFELATPYWLQQDAFSQRFRRSPIKRAKRAGMLRNVCVALGNWGAPSTIDPLEMALHDVDPLPRGHAAWALGEVAHRCRDRQDSRDRIGTMLTKRLACEADEWVREEINWALQG